MNQPTGVFSDAFADQLISALTQHWSEILHIISPTSARIVMILQGRCPSSLKRVNGVWHIQIGVEAQSKLRQPRDNEIVAQAIREWARGKAHLELPHVTITFELSSLSCDDYV